MMTMTMTIKMMRIKAAIMAVDDNQEYEDEGGDHGSHDNDDDKDD
jgi:hypothetical protein